MKGDVTVNAKSSYAANRTKILITGVPRARIAKIRFFLSLLALKLQYFTRQNSFSI